MVFTLTKVTRHKNLENGTDHLEVTYKASDSMMDMEIKLVVPTVRTKSILVSGTKKEITAVAL